MSFSIGITGLPNVGKSTLFYALTQKKVDISNYPFCTIEPNQGIVKVPDKRLNNIAQLVKPEKKTPTVIKFVDIAGLVKKAHQGEGLGNQFLAHIRECDAILEVIRAFENKNIEHVEKEINPKRDIEIIKNELIAKDLQSIEKALEKKEETFLLKLKEHLLNNKPLRDLSLNCKETIKKYQFLTAKPIIYLLNVSKETTPKIKIEPKITLDLKLEQEISELTSKEREELNLKSNLDKLIKKCYNALELITFYTITGGEEARAWTLKKGKKAPEAGERVHSDFKEKFIKAEVLPYPDLIKAGSWKKAKQRGLVKSKGKNYIVKDGDIIKFKI